MYFNPNTGAFSGTPTVPQPPIAYVVIGVNSKTKATRIFTLEVVNPLALVVTQTSNGTTNNVAFKTQPQISLTNKGVPDRANGTVVTASVSQGARLIGTTSATAYSGVAIFNNLGIQGIVGTNYTITYSVASGYKTASEIVKPVLYSIGDTGPAGGVVFYVASTAFKCGVNLELLCNFMEAAPISGDYAWTDLSAQWAGSTRTLYNYLSRTPSSAIGGGCSNTLVMMQVTTRDFNFARGDYRSRAYPATGYELDLWCVPSLGEMEILNGTQLTVGSLAPNQLYWTSTWIKNSTDAQAYYPAAIGGVQMPMPVTESLLVRLIRSF
jgi:hypothetical protein